MTKKEDRDFQGDGLVLDRKLSRDEINALKIRSYRGRVELVRSDEHMLSTLQVLRKEPVLGFDTETRPVFEKGVSYPPALVQLAGGDRAYIFQLQSLTDLGSLFRLLSNKKIIKAGVAIHDDIKALRALSDFEPGGLVDLGDCARRSGMKHHGLRGMAALLLGFRISKSCQRYNWSRLRLSQAAITYAATDAWVGRELYLVMKEQGYI